MFLQKCGILGFLLVLFCFDFHLFLSVLFYKKSKMLKLFHDYETVPMKKGEHKASPQPDKLAYA